MDRSKLTSLGPADLADPSSLTRALLDCMSEGVSLAREDGTIIYTNPAEDRMFGYEPGELLGQHVSVQNAYPTEENERVVAGVIEELKRSGSWTGEWRNRRKDGTEFVTRSRISAVEINGERHWLCVQEDVTEEVSSARALVEERARLKIATEAAEIGIWDWDLATGRMTYSDFARSVSGLPATGEITIGDVRQTVHVEDHPYTRAQAQRALDPDIRDRSPYEYRIVWPDGTVRWVLARGEAIFEDAPEGSRAVRYLGTLQDITARRELEEAERSAAQQLRLAMGAGGMAVWDLDVRTNTVTGSPELHQLLGFPAGEPIDVAAVRARYASGEAERLSAEGAAALARGETSSWAEFRYIHPSLGTRWLRLRYEIISDDGGTPYRVIGVISDETERKQAEDDLRRLNEHLEAEVARRTAERKLLADVFEGTDALMAVADPDLRLLAFNRAYADEVERLAGHRPQVGDRVTDIYAGLPDLSAAAEANWSRAIAGETFSITQELGDPARRRRSYERRFEPLYDREGHLVAAYQYATDVTERLSDQRRAADAEAARREADARYRAYFQNSGEALFVVGVLPDGGFTFEESNPAHRATLGFDIAAQPGRRIEEVVPPEVAEAVSANYRRVVETGALQRYRETGEVGGRLLHVEIVLVPVRDESGSIVRIVGSGRDMTAQVQAEEALRQSQKMEAMGQLTGGVAHDFNNLLTPILASLDRVQRKGFGDERDRRLIDGALQAAERARTLVQRLLAFARRQPLQPRAVDVAGLVHGMADLVASTTGPQIKMVLDVEHGVPAAYAETNQLEMALLNLAVNARDAMPEGGTLRISVSDETVSAAGPGGVAPGRYVRVCVADTGQGMDEATLARAVEPFFSTKGVGKGTGLGLSMVHGLVTQLGGALTIQSRPGAGTEVTLWLPVAEGGVIGLVDGVATPELMETGRRGTVLLVDDEDLVRASAADMLMDLGYQVIEAGSANHALKLMDEGLVPDLLVTDHLMPGLSGTELAKLVKARLPAIPVLVVSGYAEVDGVAPDLPRLTKPFRRTELAASLRRLGPSKRGSMLDGVPIEGWQEHL